VFYLRMTKFNVDLACQKFEKTFLFPKRYPLYYQCDYTEDFDKMMKLLEKGFCYPLPGTDSDGRTVIIFQQAKRDVDEHSSVDVLRYLRFALSVLLDDPVVQIGGIVLLFDYEDFEMKHIIPPYDLKVGMEQTKCISVRQKEYLLMNMSKVSQITVEVIRTFMTEKMNNRIKIVGGDRSNLKDYFKSMSMLPTKFGGEQSEAEAIKIFRKKCEEKKSLMDSTWKAEINWENVPAEKLEGDYQFEDMGSFRKLEID
jgi:hypothetical protein